MGKSIFAALLLFMATTARADEVRTDAFLVDVMLLRPFGVVTTIVGSALFVAISPLTALATIAPPHDAFNIAANKLILAPANFTFARRIGTLDPDVPPNRQ